MARLSETISVDQTAKSPRRSAAPPNSQYQQTSTKTRLDSTSAQNRLSQLSQTSKPVPKVLPTDMHNLWTIPSRSEFSKLSNTRSQSPITICQDSLTSYNKISFIKTLFTIKFLYKNIVYSKNLNHFQVAISVPQRGHLSFPFFHSNLPE